MTQNIFLYPYRQFSHLGDADGDHLDGGGRIVVAGVNLGNLFDKIHVFANFSENRVGRRSRFIEPIEKAVVGHVEEELGTSGFGSSC